MARAAACIALIVLASSPAAGDGLEVGGSFSYGAERVACDNCDATRWEGRPGGHVHVGYAITPRITLGLEGIWWWAGEGSEPTTRTLALLAEMRWSLRGLRSGMTVRVGYGIADTQTNQIVDGVTYDAGLLGMAIAVGIGWRFAIGSHLGIEPMLRTYVMPLGSVNVTPDVFLQNTIITRPLLLLTVSWH